MVISDLQRRYFDLLAQIKQSATLVNRLPDSIAMIAVTKSATLEQMHEAYKLGIRHFGESRLQTLAIKIPQFPNDVIWHFIGPLQSNKLGKILQHAHYIHSVSSLELAQQIAKKDLKQVRLFLQVNISQELSKHGFSVEELLTDFDLIAQLPLNLSGLMTMAPLTGDQARVRKCFQTLSHLKDKLAQPLLHLSMGMSQDFTIAIEEGATFLRIGSALFGNK